MSKLVNNNSEVKKKKGMPDHIDIHVGSRLRVRRSLMGITQEKLAKAVGLTFQQVQKYEKGLNRISAGRLFQFSRVLEVPVAYFYENLASGNTFGMSDNSQDGFSHEEPKDMMQNKETINLLKAYYSIEDAGARQDILKFIKSMAKKI
jgi:transcriptional regulator with XRE-family HTH domain